MYYHHVYFDSGLKEGASVLVLFSCKLFNSLFYNLTNSNYKINGHNGRTFIVAYSHVRAIARYFSAYNMSIEWLKTLIFNV